MTRRHCSQPGLTEQPPSPPTEREAPGPTHAQDPHPPQPAHCLARHQHSRCPGRRLLLSTQGAAAMPASSSPCPGAQSDWSTASGPRPLFLARDTRWGSYSPKPTSFRPEEEDSIFETLPVTQGGQGESSSRPQPPPPRIPPPFQEAFLSTRRAPATGTPGAAVARAGRPGSTGTPVAPRRHGVYGLTLSPHALLRNRAESAFGQRWASALSL